MKWADVIRIASVIISIHDFHLLSDAHEVFNAN